MRVRYRPAWSITFLVLAGINLSVIGINVALGGRLSVPALVPGIVCLVVGLAYRSRHYFELAEGQVRAPAAIGPLVKSYDFDDLSQVTVRDKRVWIGEKKTGLSRTLAHPDDWQAFEQQVRVAETFE